MGTGRYPTGGLTATPGPRPGEVAYQGGQAPVVQAMANRVAGFKADMYPLESAYTELGNARSGRGLELIHNLSSRFNTLGPAGLQRFMGAWSPLMTPEEVSAYDQANKFFAQMSQRSEGAARSDLGLTQANTANPSMAISNQAARILTQGAIGMRRMEQDEGQGFLNSGQPVAELNKYRAQFQKDVDPRVYTFDMMAPGQRAKLLTGMDPARRSAFVAAVQRAEANGVLSSAGMAK